MLAPEAVNAAAQQLGAGSNVLPTGEPVQPRFFHFEPPPFPRRFDARTLG